MLKCSFLSLVSNDETVFFNPGNHELIDLLQSRLAHTAIPCCLCAATSAARARRALHTRRARCGLRQVY